MRILVTGGAGFIGSCFVRHMLKSHPDYKIINLDALTYAGNIENLNDVKDNPNYTFVHGSICDKKLVPELVEQVDAVVNFAAESHVDRSITGPEIFIETNVKGTLNLLQAARHFKTDRYLQVSTDEVTELWEKRVISWKPLRLLRTVRIPHQKLLPICLSELTMKHIICLS